MLTDLGREYLSQNATERNYMETDEEVLFRQIKAHVIALELDEATPPARGETSRFELARIASGIDADVKSTNNLRKLMFSPMILHLLIEMRPLGDAFTSSSFYKVPYLSKIQGVFGGVRCNSFSTLSSR